MVIRLPADVQSLEHLETVRVDPFHETIRRFQIASGAIYQTLGFTNQVTSRYYLTVQMT